MIETTCASTLEIDEPEEAVEEILSQLEDTKLLANSVGILVCHLDFVLNGTVKALCEKLPFDVIGSTTNISDLSGQTDEYQLGLMVLTSNEVSFATGISDPLTPEGAKQSLTDEFNHTAAKLDKETSMGVFLAPFMYEVSSDEQLLYLDKAAEGIPLFGMLALDYVDGVRDPRVIYNGEDHKDCLALLLISGEITPEFYFASVPQENFLRQKAIITAAEKNLLIEVNNIRAIDYLESLGIAKDGVIENIPLIPLSIDVGDGATPSVRAIFAVTPDGSVVCGNEMPVGATLGVGNFGDKVVKATTKQMTKAIATSKNRNGAFIFSCIGRNRALGLDPMHEIEEVQAILGDKIPYLFMYSAGEMCPEYVNGKFLNKALNYSVIACTF